MLTIYGYDYYRTSTVAIQTCFVVGHLVNQWYTKICIYIFFTHCSIISCLFFVTFPLINQLKFKIYFRQICTMRDDYRKHRLILNDNYISMDNLEMLSKIKINIYSRLVAKIKISLKRALIFVYFFWFIYSKCSSVYTYN